MTTDRLSTARLRLDPLTVADASEMVGVLSGAALYAFTGGGRRAEIAWVIGLDWQGHGYAAEATQALVGWLDSRGAGVIQAHIHPGHAASAAVARRAGLRPSGVTEDGEQLWLRYRPAAAGLQVDPPRP